MVITEPQGCVGVPQGGHSGGDISVVLGIGATPGGSTRSCGRELSRDVPGVARVGRQGGRGGAGVVGRWWGCGCIFRGCGPYGSECSYGGKKGHCLKSVFSGRFHYNCREFGGRPYSCGTQGAISRWSLRLAPCRLLHLVGAIESFAGMCRTWRGSAGKVVRERAKWGGEGGAGGV